MCEFKVFLDGEKVFEDAVYLKVIEDCICLKDVLGRSKEIRNSRIIEVDVNSERLVIARINDR
jgi:predicted RNA-binding protein